jgi:hypothetical protein
MPLAVRADCSFFNDSHQEFSLVIMANVMIAVQGTFPSSFTSIEMQYHRCLS